MLKRFPPGAWLVACGLLLAAASGIISRNWEHPPPGGLTARFTWEGTALLPQRSLPSTAALHKVLGNEGANLKAEWSGFLYIDRTDEYLFRVRADDGAVLRIDDAVVVDNGGSHRPELRETAIRLNRGEHAVSVQYQQITGTYELEIYHSRRGDHHVWHWAEARWRFSETPLSTFDRLHRELDRQMASIVIAMALSGAWTAYLGLGWLLVSAARTALGLPKASRVEMVAFAAAIAWASYGLWWGIPSPYGSWTPDELSAKRVMAGVQVNFSNGFADLYPPLLYYLSAIAAPLIDFVGKPFGITPYLDPGDDLFQIFIRGIVLLSAAGALSGLYVLLRQRATAMASLVACGAAFFVGTVAYYARAGNVDMPYLAFTMWACAFLHAYFRTDQGKFLVLAAGCAAMATATKDQAAGFFALVPIGVAAAALAQHRFKRLLLDRHTWLALVLGLGLWAAVFLLPWNIEGFRQHFNYVRWYQYGPGVPPGLTGTMLLIAELAELLIFCAGFPLLLMSLAGWVIAFSRREWALAGATVLPIASYVIVFLLPIRYAYDRFLIGVWFLMAAGIALLLDRLQGRARQAAYAVAVLAIAVQGGRATMVGVLQNTDTRMSVERYITWALQPGPTIAVVGPSQYIPRFYRATDTVEIIGRNPGLDVIVVNWDYARRYRDQQHVWQSLMQLQRGETPFRLVYECRDEGGGLLDVVGPIRHFGALGWTNLDKISPHMAVYSRIPLTRFDPPEPNCH